MRGEQFIINSLVLKNLQNPIKKDIGKHTPLSIIEVIQEEYWKELALKMQFGNTLSISVKHLGVYIPNLSKLKGYLRRGLRLLKKLRIKIKKAIETNGPIFDTAALMKLEQELTLKMKAAWKQVDEIRQLIIIRTIRSNNKKRKLGLEQDIKVNYEWFPFSFVPKLLIIADNPIK